MRLIDADKLKAHYSWWKDGSGTSEMKIIFDDIIDLQPTVEPTKGHWIKSAIGWKCSNCGDVIVIYAELDGHFCPHCGAKMDKEND